MGLNPSAKPHIGGPQSPRHIENAFPTDRETLFEIKDLFDRVGRLVHNAYRITLDGPSRVPPR